MDQNRLQFAKEVEAIARALGHYWATHGKEFYERVQGGEEPWFSLPEGYAERIRTTPFEETVLTLEGRKLLQAIHDGALGKYGFPGISHPSIQEEPGKTAEDGVPTRLTYEHVTGSGRFRIKVALMEEGDLKALNSLSDAYAPIMGEIAVESPKGTALVLRWKEWPEQNPSLTAVTLTPGDQSAYHGGIAPGPRHYVALKELLEDLARINPTFGEILEEVREPLEKGIARGLRRGPIEAEAGALLTALDEKATEALYLSHLLQDYAKALSRENPHLVFLSARWALEAASSLEEAREYLERGLDLVREAVPGARPEGASAEWEAARQAILLLREALEREPESAQGMARALEGHVRHFARSLEGVSETLQEVFDAVRDHEASLWSAFPSEEDAERRREAAATSEDALKLLRKVAGNLMDAEEEAKAAVLIATDATLSVRFRGEEVKVGPNGNLGEYENLHPIDLLEGGGKILYGSFSGETGYSGWWNEVWLRYDTEKGKEVVVARVNESDTSHRDSDAIIEEPVADWELIKNEIAKLPPAEAYKEMDYLLSEKLRELSSMGHALPRGSEIEID